MLNKMFTSTLWDKTAAPAKILNTIFLAFLINLVASGVSADKEWAEIPSYLGWWSILIPISSVLLALEYRATQRITTIASEERQKFMTLYDRLRVCISKQIFDLLAETAIYPNNTGPLNIHLFLTKYEEGREVLVKDRRFFYELEHMPSNYSLDTVYPDEDQLVICKAFNVDTIIYEELTQSTINSYNERIMYKVDPEIFWVLACPLHVDRRPPLGVLCAFGARPFFETTDSLRYFEHLMIKTAEVLVWMIEFDRRVDEQTERT